MKYLVRLLVSTLAVTFLFLFFSTSIFAQTLNETYLRGTVREVKEQGERDVNGVKVLYQTVDVTIDSVEEKDKVVTIDHGLSYSISEDLLVSQAEKVVVVKSHDPTTQQDLYSIRDKYRLNGLIFVALIFLGLIMATSGLHGLGSIVGLAISFAVIVKFIIPQIIAGRDPVVITIIGSFFILFVTIYLAHGFTKKTSASVVATFISLIAAGVIAAVFTRLTSLTGMGSEAAYALQFGPTSIISLKGLFLAGIIIGTLGVLDDVTTAQSAAIFELKKRNANLKFNDLVKSGMAIGREHIAAVVNTLVLAYAGSSLALFVIFVLNPQGVPVWTMFNEPIIAEEIIRSLAGSIGLILSVPLTTLISAYWVSKK